MNSVVLDVFIGLFFIYCLYSLLATAVKEAIASILNLRAKTLYQAINRMLTDSSDDSPIKEVLFNAFYSHPLIKYFSSGKRLHQIPSYISPESFSKILFDILRDDKNSDSALKMENIKKGIEQLLQVSGQKNESDTITLIKSFLRDADNNIDKFRQSVEKWFNETMDRTSGWYKRKSYLIVFTIGLFIAVGFNVNTFDVVSRLSKDKDAREQLSGMAANYLQNQPIKTDSLVETDIEKQVESSIKNVDSLYQKDIHDANIIIGAGWSSLDQLWQSIKLWNILGWLVTAIAISFGAPFWFQLLSKLVPLRGTGPRIATESENKEDEK